MLFIKAVTTNYDTVNFFNLDKILNIIHHNDGTSKILMGAGLYWEVYTNTIEEVNILNHLQNN